MTTSHSAQRVLQGLMLGSLGLLTVELLQPVDVHAQSCTLDPLGGEVCLPDDTPPNDPPPPEDPPKDPTPPKDSTPTKDPPKENDPKDPKDPKDPEKPQEPKEPKNSKAPKLFRKQKPVVIVPPCFGPCTQFPPAPTYRQFAEEAASKTGTDAGTRRGTGTG